MGGSILGTAAVKNFLSEKIKKEIILIDNIDILTISKINKIKKLKNSFFFLISKSGNTLEVLSIINFLNKKANFNQSNTLVITENKKNQLNYFAKNLKIKVIHHRNYIGGRYSVFSETALLPLYFMGINIVKLKKNILRFFKKEKSLLVNNVISLLKIYGSKNINSLVLLNYCPQLSSFLLWCQQLIAESLGKKGKGLIPIISTGPRDHHSLLQLYLDGPKDKFFYIFSLKEDKRLSGKKGHFKEILNHSNIDRVLQSQKKAIITILKEKKIPFVSIEMREKNEETIGELFSYFILETILISESLRINPFNQPAVEQIKILTKKNLFKKKPKII